MHPFIIIKKKKVLAHSTDRTGKNTNEQWDCLVSKVKEFTACLNYISKAMILLLI